MNLRRAIAVAVAATCIAGFAPAAHADPDAVAEARQTLERIQQEASAIDQEIIEASARAEEGRTKLAQVTSDLRSEEAKVQTMSRELGAIALVQQRAGGIDITAQLLTSDSESSFLSGLATIQNEANRSNSVLQALQVQQAEVDLLRAEADRTSTALTADLEAKKQLALEFDAKEAEAVAVHDRLDAEEKERLRQLEIERQRQQDEADRLARLAAEEAAAASRAANGEEAPTAADTGTTGTGTTGSATATEEDSSTPTGNGSRALAAISAATSKVGSRYVWGTSGPGTFDCSGLTSFAYRQVGISLPRSSRAQYSMGTKVAKSDLQPGDLVFYYSPVSHVGIYIGNGKIVDAANPRSGVRIAGLNSMPFTGARRIS